MAKRDLSISLAAKCQLLFGFAVIIIITGALMVPWLRMEQLANRQPVYEAEVLTSLALRQIHHTVPRPHPASTSSMPPRSLTQSEAFKPAVVIPLVHRHSDAYKSPPVLASALEYFRHHPHRRHYGFVGRGANHKPVYYQVTGIYATQSCLECHQAWRHLFPPRSVKIPSASIPAAAIQPLTKALVAVVQAKVPIQLDQDQLLLNRVVIIVSGLIGGALAIIVFYLITTRLILQPVRVLRNTAEKVSRGDLSIRSAISTGDEFEQLADTFNNMLGTLQASQTQLEATNRSLDTRLVELSRSNVDLNQANKVKTDFLTNVTHELRTPLNAILGFADLLLTSESISADSKLNRYTENIQSSARQLLELINDLLDLAKIEAGKMVLRPQRLVVPDICESLVNFMKPLSSKKNLHMSLTINGNIPMVTTDAARLQQILFNFLSNSIKFTPSDGSVLVTIEMADVEVLAISVTDTGPGIAPEQQESIFEKFQQIDASVTKQHSGTGLGLAISRELATMMGCKITLVSAVGHGATFTLLVPVEFPSRPPATSADPLLPPPPSS